MAAGSALAVLLVFLAITLTASAPRQLSSNLVRPLAFMSVLQPGRELCQAGERIPRDAGSLQYRIGTYGRPGPELALRVTGGGRATAGRLAAGWREGDVRIPLAAAQNGPESARVCLRNAGSDRIALAGEPAPAASAARIRRHVEQGRVRIEYYDAHAQTWLAFAGDVADRVGHVHGAVPGGATFWIWLVLAVGAIGGAVAVVVREGSR